MSGGPVRAVERVAASRESGRRAAALLAERAQRAEEARGAPPNCAFAPIYRREAEAAAEDLAALVQEHRVKRHAEGWPEMAAIFAHLAASARRAAQRLRRGGA